MGSCEWSDVTNTKIEKSIKISLHSDCYKLAEIHHDIIIRLGSTLSNIYMFSSF